MAAIVDANRNPVHLLVRIPSTSDRLEDIVAAHNDIVAQHGCVWFGVSGSVPSIGAIGDQTQTMFYVAQREYRGLAGYRAKLLSLSKELPKDEARLVPPYYVILRFVDRVRLWAKIGKLTQASAELDHLYVARSGRKASDVLLNSMASALVVRHTKQ